MKYVIVSNQSNSKISPIRAGLCDQFGSRLMGLMFTKNLGIDRGLLFVHNHESRVDASIHMLFMFYDIAVIWINSRLEVVDVNLAKKWHPIYIPSAPAFYTLEIHPIQLDNFKIGNTLQLQDE
jgi:uncharacterized protein